MQNTDDVLRRCVHDERLAIGEAHREREADPICYKSIRSRRVLHRITNDQRLCAVHLLRTGFFVRSKNSGDVMPARRSCRRFRHAGMRAGIRLRPQNNFDPVGKWRE